MSGSGAGASASIADSVFARFDGDGFKPTSGLKEGGTVSGLAADLSKSDDLLLIVSMATRRRPEQISDPSMDSVSSDEVAVDELFADLFDGIAVAI